MVVFVEKWLYSGNVVVFGQKWLYLGKLGFFGEKKAAFIQICFNLAKVIVFRKK